VSQRDLADARWLKSSYTGGQNVCVELARTPTILGIRDSKNPGPTLRLPLPALTAFLTETKSGTL
jgi:hypothetical protein